VPRRCARRRPSATSRSRYTADVNAIGLVRGYVGEIHVSANGLERDEVRIGALDLTARDVAIGDHSFSAVNGTLEAVSVLLPDAVTLLEIRSVDISGPSDAVVATAHLDRDAALAFMRWSFAMSGSSSTTSTSFPAASPSSSSTSRSRS
jgi:hypothetical protein